MSKDPKAELLQQIRTIRRRIDPAVLARAEAAAQAVESARADAQAPSTEVPYDKEAAREAVTAFLRGRNDGGRFAMQLMENLQKPDAAAKAYGGPGPAHGVTKRV